MNIISLLSDEINEKMVFTSEQEKIALYRYELMIPFEY